MLNRGFSGKFYNKGGRQIALFSTRIKSLQIDCTDTKKVDGIAIYLRPEIAKGHRDLYEYAGMVLSIHGIQAEIPMDKISLGSIVAFGLNSDKSPTMAAKLACFKNADIIISNIRKHVPTTAELAAR